MACLHIKEEMICSQKWPSGVITSQHYEVKGALRSNSVLNLSVQLIKLKGSPEARHNLCSTACEFLTSLPRYKTTYREQKYFNFHHARLVELTYFFVAFEYWILKYASRVYKWTPEIIYPICCFLHCSINECLGGFIIALKAV